MPSTQGTGANPNPAKQLAIIEEMVLEAPQAHQERISAIRQTLVLLVLQTRKRGRPKKELEEETHELSSRNLRSRVHR